MSYIIHFFVSHVILMNFQKNDGYYEKRALEHEKFFLNYIKEKVDYLNIFFELGHTESIKGLLVNRECLTCISKISVESEIAEGKLYQVPVKKL